jgi:hypothetical protein
VKRVYVQSRNDDGGFASRGLAPLGDYAAVSSLSEFVEVLRPKSSPSDVVLIRSGSMTSVPGVPANLYTDTRSRVPVHALSVPTLLAPQADSTEVSA